MNNKWRKLVMIVGTSVLVLVIFLSITYALINYNKTGDKTSKLVLGDIYTKYTSGNKLNLTNVFPSDTYDPSIYFEFTITGKNTHTKYDVIYDIALAKGAEVADKSVRIDDSFIKLRLVELVDDNENVIIDEIVYSSISYPNRIASDKVYKNTTTEINRTYRLYVWISSDVLIGNVPDADYSSETWKNDVYASFSVDVTGSINYDVDAIGSMEESKTLYDLSNGSWSGETIVIEFRAKNEIDEMIVTDKEGNIIKTCTMILNGEIRTCQVEISTSGEYIYYGISGDKISRKQEFKILVDKEAPTYEIRENGTENLIEVETDNKITVNNEIQNIKDIGSGIESIEYSFEKEGNETNYNTLIVGESVEISKELERGNYNLIIRVRDKAGNETIKEVKYKVYTKLDITPTVDNYCKSVMYNGSSQTITEEAPDEFSLSGNIGTNAGDYTVTATLNDNYQWSDGSKNDKTFNCTITKKDVSVTAKGQTINYGSSITTGTGQITVSGLVNGHSVTAVTLTGSTTEATTSGTITPSAATVMDGETDVSDNYDISYEVGILVINRASTVIPAGTYCRSVTYNGSSQTITNAAGTGYTFSGNTGTNAGTYTVTATLNGNYQWSDGTTTNKTFNCTIGRASTAIPAAGTYCRSVTYNGGSQTLTNAAGTGYTFSGNTGINVGSYTVTATLNGNYQWSDGTTTNKTFNCTIGRASTAIPAAGTYCKSITYNGSSQTLTNAAGTGYTFSGTAGTNAGNYTVTATLNGNYQWSDGTTANKTFVCTIAKAKTATTGSCAAKTYTGGSQTLASGAANATYSNNAGTNIGSYTVTVTAGSNYTFSDGATSKTLSCSIVAGTYTIAFNGNGSTSGSTASITCTYGTACALRSNGFVRTGYGFIGWATSAGGGVSYGNGASVTSLAISGTVTLYAVWNIQPSVGSATGSATSTWFAAETLSKANNNRVAAKTQASVTITGGANTNGIEYWFSSGTNCSGYLSGPFGLATNKLTVNPTYTGKYYVCWRTFNNTVPSATSYYGPVWVDGVAPTNNSSRSSSTITCSGADSNSGVKQCGFCYTDSNLAYCQNEHTPSFFINNNKTTTGTSSYSSWFIILIDNVNNLSEWKKVK